MYQDPSGESFILAAIAVGAAVGAWASNISQLKQNGGDWGAIDVGQTAIGALKGGAMGAAMAVPGVQGLGVVSTMGYAGLVGAGIESVSQLAGYARGKDVDYGAITGAGIGSALGAGLGYGITNIAWGLSKGKGFNTFNEFKKANGSAGQGKQWHHIVEQCQIKKSGFNSSQVHNTKNIVSVNSAIHPKISGHYNTKTFKFTNGMKVRDWLSGQSYSEQYKYGIQILKDFGVKK